MEADTPTLFWHYLRLPFHTWGEPEESQTEQLQTSWHHGRRLRDRISKNPRRERHSRVFSNALEAAMFYIPALNFSHGEQWWLLKEKSKCAHMFFYSGSMHLINFIFYFIPVAPFLLFTLPGLTSGTPGTFLPTPWPCPSHTGGYVTILGWNSDNFLNVEEISVGNGLLWCFVLGLSLWT